MACVATGAEGLVIVDSERSEAPRRDRVFTVAGGLDDAWEVKVAMTSASVLAYVADGVNGLRVVQLVSANAKPGAFGFSPRPPRRWSPPTAPADRRWRYRRASTATGRWTRRATRWRSSASAAPGRSR